MSNEVATQTQQAPPVLQAKDSAEYVPFGSEDRIRLTTSVIRNLIAIPTREGELPDDRDCMRFLMLCRSRRLDPFTGDAFLIGFKKRDAEKAEWSLITSQSAFMKRAEIHPEFDGIESGVIVQTEDEEIIERQGDFTFKGDQLLGGWAVVHFRSRKFPMRKKVKLTTYQKPFGVWATDPAGMICKVAEVHALRDAFPTMLGGMLLREEHLDIASEVVSSQPVKRPDFAKGLPAPDLSTGRVNSVSKPETQRQTTPAKPAPTAQGVQTVPAASNATTAPTQEQPQATAKPTGRANRPTMVEEPPDDPGDAELADAGLAPVATQGQFVPDPKDSDVVQSVLLLGHNANITEAQIMKFLVVNKISRGEENLRHFSDNKRESKLLALATAWQKDPAGFSQKILEANT